MRVKTRDKQKVRVVVDKKRGFVSVNKSPSLYFDVVIAFTFPLGVGRELHTKKKSDQPTSSANQFNSPGSQIDRNVPTLKTVPNPHPEPTVSLALTLSHTNFTSNLFTADSCYLHSTVQANRLSE